MHTKIDNFHELYYKSIIENLKTEKEDILKELKFSCMVFKLIPKYKINYKQMIDISKDKLKKYID